MENIETAVAVPASNNHKKIVCLVVIVEPGIPDRGIRIYPAEKEYEKIDMSNMPGRERWASIQQLMRRYCPRGQYVPEPLTFNPDHPKNLSNPPPPPDQWPLIELDGAILDAPPSVKRPPRVQESVESGLSARIDKLENIITRLASAIPTATDCVNCGECKRSFKNEHALKIHVGRYHKK